MMDADKLIQRYKSGERNFKDVSLREADLHGVDLSGTDLCGANLHGANLSGANLHGANLSGANLGRANLSRANLSRANPTTANLSGADLSGANLSWAYLGGANLTRANLSGADLTDCVLSMANLSQADLSGAKVTLWQLAEAQDFAAAKLPDGSTVTGRLGSTTVGPPISVPKLPSYVQRCQRCGSVRPVHHIKLESNIGLLVIRFRQSVEGNLCWPCIQEEYRSHTTTNWLLGWWGIISFFATLTYLGGNWNSYREAKQYFKSLLPLDPP